LIREHDIPIERFATMSLVRSDDVLAVLQGQSIKNSVETSEHMPENQSIKAIQAKAIAITKVPTTEISLSRMKRSEIQSLTSGARNVLPSMVSVTCLTHGLRAALQTNPIVACNLGAVIVFEVARLLRKYPAFNATYRTDTMLVYEQVNVGYAMDDGRGLKVSVLQNCDRKSLSEITTELRTLTVAYLDDKLTPAQTSGGTFTISDLSSMGVSGFMPLISEDQGAILGVGGEQFLPGSRDGLYTLTLTFDHQLSEGRTAALFLNDLKDRLRNYEKAMAGATIPPSIHCARCGRGIEDLPDANSYMVPSAVPAGHLCNLCVAGF
jgi:2-oxoglutarate dehydrogenase E2 component (dihydrolipoamide succinyltransferase)